MKRLAILIIAGFWTHYVLGQDATNPLFIGIQPNITVEPFYEKREFDVDVLPIVFETPIGSHTNLKVSPIVNYHFGGKKEGVSDLGIFCVLPVFIFKKDEIKVRPYGFYLGPVLGLGRNILNKHYTTTLAVEPGYMFKAKKNFTISAGIQLGGSYFIYDTKPNKWVSHWGPKISFGYWLN